MTSYFTKFKLEYNRNVKFSIDLYLQNNMMS